MTSVEDILKLKERFIKELYSKTREEQRTDKEYIDDVFVVGDVKHPHKVLRLGLGYEIVNAPADQIVTSNPQAFIEVLKGKQESGERIGKFINKQIDILKRQNPNPFKESVKNKGGRGENYIKLSHNEEWVTNPIDKDKKGLPIFDTTGMPILFSIPDPMVIYGSPEEDVNGIPKKLIAFYERQPIEVILRYPKWSNPKASGKEKKLVEWFEYIDDDTIYCEADGERVKYIPNPYGIVPAVRKYSGFGRRSPDGELSSLIVSDIRYSRGMIEEVCTMRSDIASLMHLSAHKPITITSTGKVREDLIREHLDLTAFGYNILDELPADFKFEDIKIDQPTREAFEHTANIMADLTRKHPFILAGFPFGASGRQQGMSEMAGMRRYDTVIENTELEWGTAFELMFKVMKGIPTMLPEGLHKEDLDTVFRCTVKLKAKDPIEEDRLITLGDRLRRLPNPGIDLGTFHRDFLGYTEEKSKSVKVQMLADMVTIYNPDWAAVAGMVAAEEGGMERWLGQLKQREAMMGQGQGLEGQPPRTTQERNLGEVQTEQGREAGVEPNRGGRFPPTRYTRGE